MKDTPAPKIEKLNTGRFMLESAEEDVVLTRLGLMAIIDKINELVDRINQGYLETMWRPL